jgi:hypothetical protein
VLAIGQPMHFLSSFLVLLGLFVVLVAGLFTVLCDLMRRDFEEGMVSTTRNTAARAPLTVHQAGPDDAAHVKHSRALSGAHRR